MQTLWIAGTPLEPYKLQHRNETCSSANVQKLCGLGNQQLSFEQKKVHRLFVEASASKRRAPMLRNNMVKI